MVKKYEIIKECRWCEVGHTFETDEYYFSMRIGMEGKLIVEAYTGKRRGNDKLLPYVW